MKVLKLLALLLLSAGTCKAAPSVMARGDFDSEVQKTIAATKLLILKGQSPWYIVVVSKDEFFSSIGQAQQFQSRGTCYTLIPVRMTYCNADWIGKSFPEQIAASLAHEYGHLACACRIEKRADDEAKNVLH